MKCQKSREWLAECTVVWLVWFVIWGQPADAQGVVWEQIGPYGGTIQAILVTPDDILFAGTSGGGVFHSEDKGNTWTSVTYAKQEGTGRGMEITTQFFGGYLAGAVGGIALDVAILQHSKDLYGWDDIITLWSYLALGAATGMVLASSGSVYGIGQAWGHRSGSFGKTLLGASIPPLVGSVALGTYALATQYDSGEVDFSEEVLLGFTWGAFFGSFLSPIGAIVGYHLSAQPRKTTAIFLEGPRSPRSKYNGRALIVPLLQIEF